MKHIKLEAGKDVEIITPHGSVVIGISNPTNPAIQPQTHIYFVGPDRRITRTHKLTDVIGSNP